MQQSLDFRTRPNSVPHTMPRSSNRRNWHAAYLPELVRLYDILQRVVSERYPERRITWDDNTTFNDFSRLIFNCSSGHISDFLE
jgi:hypothetical protein